MLKLDDKEQTLLEKIEADTAAILEAARAGTLHQYSLVYFKKDNLGEGIIAGATCPGCLPLMVGALAHAIKRTVEMGDSDTPPLH